MAEGNVKSLASNLVITFTTTVVGMLVSATAYGWRWRGEPGMLVI